MRRGERKRKTSLTLRRACPKTRKSGVPRKQLTLIRTGTRFSKKALLEDLRSEFFPELPYLLHLRIGFIGQLAYVRHTKWDATIYLHSIFDHPDTPFEVLRCILKHELLHLRILARRWQGEVNHHPARFWAHEGLLSPEAGAVWKWLEENFSECMEFYSDGSIRVRNDKAKAHTRFKRKPFLFGPKEAKECLEKLKERLSRFKENEPPVQLKLF